MNLFLLGATVMAAAVAGLFFLRLWRESRDRLYAYFACAFWLEAIARGLRVFTEKPNEADPMLVLVRIAAYGLIVVAIIDKNLVGRGGR